MTRVSEAGSTRSPRQISRRTVAKGAAWSVPAIAFAAGTPAWAASPGSCGNRTCDELNDDLSFDSGTSTRSAYRVAYFPGGHSTSDSLFYGTGNQAVGWRSGWTYAACQTQINNCVSNESGHYFCDTAYRTGNDVTLSGKVFAAEGDPKVKDAAIVLSVVVCLRADCTYTFSLPWISFNGNTLAAYLHMGVAQGDTGVSVLPSGGTTSGMITASRNDAGSKPTHGCDSNDSNVKHWVKNGKGTLTLDYTPTTTGTHTFYVQIWFENSSNDYKSGNCSGCAAGANDFAINAPTVTCHTATA